MEDETLYERLLRYKKEGKDAVLVTAVEKKGEGPVAIGIKMLVSEDDEAIGTVGGGALEYHARERCKDIIKKRESKLERYLLNEEKIEVDNRSDMTTLPMKCGGVVTLFYEFIGVKNHIYLFGAGHVSKALGHVLDTMDFHLTVIDDRKEVLDVYPYGNRLVEKPFVQFIEEEGIKDGSFVVVCTPKHANDYHVINKILELGLSPKYMGMLCSSAKLKDYLKKTYDTFGEDVDLSNFYAPIGLDTGGGSPEEIAVSISSEILAVSHGKKGHLHMRETENGSHRYWED